MKKTARPAQTRRKAAPKQVRLNLRRAEPPPSPEEDLESNQRSSFWKWFGLVALFHLLVLLVVLFVYRPMATPPPPAFISLVPQGDIVQGTPGAQAAPKVGATSAASVPHHHHLPKPPAPEPVETPPPPAPAAVEPPPKPIVHPKPIVREENAPALAEEKPKPKPIPPKPKIKVKVDLHLADGPTPPPEKPLKPKHEKKTPPPADVDRQEDPDRDAATPETTGLSREQIATRLGEKLQEEGVTHASHVGASGSPDSHASPFADFYASIHDQFMNKWQPPGMEDPGAAQPVLQIHVEKDGRVPPDRVTLLKSSGNATLDDSALEAARSLGYLLQPLPDGCPPDITLNLKLTQ